MPAHSLLQWQKRGQLHRLWKRHRLPRSRTLLHGVTGGGTFFMLLFLLLLFLYILHFTTLDSIFFSKPGLIKTHLVLNHHPVLSVCVARREDELLLDNNL